MEDALVQAAKHHGQLPMVVVLILVLMEDALVPAVESAEVVASQVLILVLMEDALVLVYAPTHSEKHLLS